MGSDSVSQLLNWSPVDFWSRYGNYIHIASLLTLEWPIEHHCGMYCSFYPGRSCESAVQDCMELLLPMAAKKLDLAFNIEPNVPTCKFCTSTMRVITGFSDM